MAIPAVRANKAAIMSTTSGVTSFTQTSLAEASGWSQNDGIFLLVAVGVSGVSWTPTGFTTIQNTSAAGSSFWCGWARRGASAITYTIAWSSGSSYTEALMFAVSDVPTSGSIIDVSGTSGTSTRNPGNLDCPSVTTTGADRLAIACGANGLASAAGGWTAPSGYTVIANLTSVAQPAIACASKGVASAGAENPGAFANAVSGSSDVHEVTFAILPASVPGLSIPVAQQARLNQRFR